MKPVSEMTRKEFDAVPFRESWNSTVTCNSLVILPGRIKDMHDSGYRVMDFVAVGKDRFPICRLSGCSDVIHIDGIGGLGHNWLERTGSVPESVRPVAWAIDCLPKSGLLRLFYGKEILCGEALSSFDIYSEASP